MTKIEFDKLVDERFQELKKRIEYKSTKYGKDDNRFESLQELGKELGTDMIGAWKSQEAKHHVTLKRYIQNPKDVPIEEWIETIGDEIVYLLILEGLVRESMEERKGIL